MSRKPVPTSQRPAATSPRAVSAKKKPRGTRPVRAAEAARLLETDHSQDFNNSWNGAVSRVAVLHELSSAKMAESTATDCDFWSGMEMLAGDVLVDLEKMRAAEGRQADALFALKQGRRPAKGERKSAMAGRTGGAQ